MNRVRNFCAGPCTLPVEVLAEEVENLQVELWNARLGIQASAAPPEEPEPAETAATGEVDLD